MKRINISRLILILVFFLSSSICFGTEVSEFKLGSRLNVSPIKQNLLSKLSKTSDSIGKLAKDLETKAQQSADETEKHFWLQMSAKLFEINKLSASANVVYELGCYQNAKGCVTWTLVENQIVVRFGFGIPNNAFPNWSELEWLELVAHELNHALDILTSHQKRESLLLLKTEANSFFLSGLIYWNAGKDFEEIAGIRLWKKKMNQQPFAKQKQFLESNISRLLNAFPYYKENASEFAYIASPKNTSDASLTK